MRKRISSRKFGKLSAHRKAMMSNLASSLIEHKRIKTTHDKKAEECSPEYMSANVKIKVNGKDHERFIKIPKGDPENFMTQEEFIEKFDGLVEPYLTLKKSDELKNLFFFTPS